MVVNAHWCDLTNRIAGRDPSVGIAGEISFAVGIKNIVLDTTSVAAGKL